VSEGIPEHFLSVILSDLRQRGIVRGRRGPDGGYQLNVDPSKLNLAEVVESLGGPLFPFTCLQRGTSGSRCSECPGEGRCPAESALGRASAAAYAALESIFVSELAVEDAVEPESIAAGTDVGRSGLRSKVTPSDPESRRSKGNRS
jgi:Rrf2 family protein